jgi:hypothetical protein
MAQLQIVCLLRPGTQEHWRRLYQAVAGSRRDQFEASCRQAGISQMRVWMVQLLHGELLLMTLNTQEPQQTLKALATSDYPFDRWVRQQFQALLGWNVQDVLPGPQYDLIFSWPGDSFEQM